MDTLRQKNNIEKYVSELNGYLAATSHLNDDVGYRHKFFADLIYLAGKSAMPAAEEYTGIKNIKMEKITLEEEEILIENYIFNNFMLGEKKISKNFNFVQEQLRWHIQDYITMISFDNKTEDHWVHKSKNDFKNASILFIKNDDLLVVISFLIMIEAGGPGNSLPG